MAGASCRPRSLAGEWPLPNPNARRRGPNAVRLRRRAEAEPPCGLRNNKNNNKVGLLCRVSNSPLNFDACFFPWRETREWENAIPSSRVGSAGTKRRWRNGVGRSRENDHEPSVERERSRIDGKDIREISSPQNDFVKHCVKLRQSSTYRKLHKSFLLVGDDPVNELFQMMDGNEKLSDSIETLFILQGHSPSEAMTKWARNIVFASSVVIQKLSGFKTPPSPASLKYIAVVNYPPTYLDFFSEPNHRVSESVRGLKSFDSTSDFDSKMDLTIRSFFEKEPSRILVLDAIQDPGNLGTLIRTAAAFAWDCIFLLPGCCDPFNEKAISASKGAIFRVPIITGHWNTATVISKSYRLELYAAEARGDDEAGLLEALSTSPSHSTANGEAQEHLSLDEFEPEDGGLCLVLGNEGHGVSETVRSHCRLLGIPMPGRMESLNVAMAGAIFLYTMRKR